MGSLLTFFKKGFDLTNKSLDIYLIKLIIYSLYLVNYLLPYVDSTIIAIIITVPLLPIIFLLNTSFSLSLPVFLLRKQQNKSTDLQNIFSVTTRNIKRLILPLILIFLIFMLVGITFLISLTALLGWEQFLQSSQSLSNYTKRWNPFIILSAALSSFFVFSPFLFSLENKGLISSLKGSVALSFKHLSYILWVFLANFISYSIYSFFLTETWGLFLTTAINFYIGLLVTSSTLFYYQKISSKS